MTQTDDVINYGGTKFCFIYIAATQLFLALSASQDRLVSYPDSESMHKSNLCIEHSSMSRSSSRPFFETLTHWIDFSESDGDKDRVHQTGRGVTLSVSGGCLFYY